MQMQPIPFSNLFDAQHKAQTLSRTKNNTLVVIECVKSRKFYVDEIGTMIRNFEKIVAVYDKGIRNDKLK